MEVVLLVVLAVGLALLVWLLAERLIVRRWLAGRTRQQVAVHLVDGTSLVGVLWEVAADVLVLRAARVLDPAGNSEPPADGEVAIPRGRVAWLQVLPGGDGS